MKQKKLRLRCKNQERIQETEKYLQSLEGKPVIFYTDDYNRLQVREATPQEIAMFQAEFPSRLNIA